ncbi:zinc finger CCCH domain-containing protein 15-like [Olea europaea var. sylvestris]|uniref:zinc finger CCCH domain-containing protein 15-like n=1 Tax=Olea europaea var. sylvestris TaxID=158386 RepID=UPI000C1D7DE1|nr:zinc finger CCCH domain-containing protein 15-like [Olea europaea var. sylvestris]XP_022878916.1 zinc finger CCCH domain-containing protein 15-like [Olea europaea var. sylvestris]
MQREIYSDCNFVGSLYPSSFPSSQSPFLDYVTGDSNFPSSNINSQPNDDDTLLSSCSHQIQLQHQDMIEQHHTVFSHLQKTAKQVQSLRQDNVNLKMANIDLNHRLKLLVNSTSSFGLSGLVPGSSSGWDPIVDGLGKMSLGGEDGPGEKEEGENEVTAAFSQGHSTSPKSVVDLGRVGGSGEERISLPKSISVRSSGYLKTARAVGMSNGGRVKAQDRTKTQRVYVSGGKKVEEALELEVYNQGMHKTELCNKWQQTGTCPYGDHCQFAHGIKELRPVLRHPRYKTEVCRMVLNGDHCPYGHRCHFRHSLTDQEKLMRSMNTRLLKPR